METANQHCQLGLTNPQHEAEELTQPEEFIMGKFRTKAELIEMLNTDSRIAFFEDEHTDGQLYIRCIFEEGESE